MTNPAPRYEPRHIQFAGIEQLAGCRLKRYHILRKHHVAHDSLVSDALHTAEAYIVATQERAAVKESRWWTLPSHRVGSLVVHEGADANFVLIDMWVDENMLRHHVWSSPRGGGALQSTRDTDLAVCVWELAVIQHERAAWLRHVLRNDAPEDIDAYLRDTIDAWV
ncbi:MAG: hypothetical protein IT353_06200 [Gemmatimonadaceae bacterium]|nr:hypothetical protein [Gemmatimonadaceae bacterium]